ncbi:MAG: ABC transporter ATP-binding protein [Propionibacteriaceae bacterium]|jgi:ABC-type multidrug transport system ATPase subunit|nr:ABC transporter ATP-binding protein [Propionibacteriaceae bacterium]
MLEVAHLTKRYGKTLANDDVSLRVAAGELTILLGPNGAGKSTLIKSICGLLRFKGTVTIAGQDNHSTAAKRLLGYVPEFPAPYQLLTINDHLEFIARAYRLTDWRPLAAELLERFDLGDKANKLGKELSKGMQQKLSVCCALLPRPRVVIFDEPLVGLDPQGIRELKAQFADLRHDGCALLISTHMIGSMDDNWDATIVMKDGRVQTRVHPGELPPGESLEDAYFAITDGPTGAGDQS